MTDRERELIRRAYRIGYEAGGAAAIHSLQTALGAMVGIATGQAPPEIPQQDRWAIEAAVPEKQT